MRSIRPYLEHPVCSKALAIETVEALLVSGRRHHRGVQFQTMVKFWFVRCKTCQTPLADEDSTFVSDPKDPQWQSPQWKSVIKCPECHGIHEYTWADLDAKGVE